MRKIEGEERDALILSITKRIEEDTQVIGAPERAEVWERGWSDALVKFNKSPVDESLIPAFIHNEQPVRWQQEFYQPDAEQNELRHILFMQQSIGDCIVDCECIAEFGCGTGFNLIALASNFPKKKCYGIDLSLAAVELANNAGRNRNLPVMAYRDDMLDPKVQLPPQCGVFTFGAIEQLASKFQPFMEYLIAQHPKVVVHVEPTVELLDPANQVDALAIAFMRKRGYTEGLLPWLQNDPRVEMIHVERTGFGSLMIEAYNLIVWKPK